MPAPTVLLVGFLGSGKTTFLRNLLPLLEARGLEPFVVINDYQNAKIDATSLKSLVKEVIPLNGNCVCCDSIHELINTLLAMPEKPNRVVLIEANGTTDPFSLIEHLVAHVQLRAKFFPLIQVGVVDIKRWQKRAWQNDLERLQAESASHLFFTRLDTESPKSIARVRADLEWLNPRAVETTLDELAEELAGLTTTSRRQPGEMTFSVTKSKNKFSIKSHQHHHQLSHGFVAVQIDLPKKVDGSALMAWLRQISASVLRVKGVCQLLELPGIHFVFQRTDDTPPQPTMFPLLDEPAIPPCAVLIGVRLDEESLRQDAITALGGMEVAT
jgi:G3E family GTPase